MCSIEWTDEDALSMSPEKRDAITKAFRAEDATKVEWSGFDGSGVHAYWKMSLVWPGFQA